MLSFISAHYHVPRLMDTRFPLPPADAHGDNGKGHTHKWRHHGSYTVIQYCDEFQRDQFKNGWGVGGCEGSAVI